MDSRIIVLTGCSRGLGRALLDRFVEQGHVVIGCGRSIQAMSNLRSLYGPPHHFTPLDVCDAKGVEQWASEAIQKVGPPDLIVNNAGVINRTRPLWEVPVEELSAVVDVNIKGAFHVIRAFLPAMLPRGKGVIVNVTSGWGRSVDAEVAPYCASKWGLEGMTLALAKELPTGLSAVPLNPGVIDTDMLRSCWGEQAASCHKPDVWSRKAAEMILEFGPEQNGQQLAVSLNGD